MLKGWDWDDWWTISVGRGMTFYKAKEWQNCYLREHEKSRRNCNLLPSNKQRWHSSSIIQKHWKQQKAEVNTCLLNNCWWAFVYLWWPFWDRLVAQGLQGLHGSVVSCCLAGASLANKLVSPHRQLHIEDLRNRIMVPGRAKRRIFKIKNVYHQIRGGCYFVFSTWHKNQMKSEEEEAPTFWAKLSIHTVNSVPKLKAHHFIRVNYFTMACWPTTWLMPCYWISAKGCLTKQRDIYIPSSFFWLWT